MHQSIADNRGIAKALKVGHCTAPACGRTRADVPARVPCEVHENVDTVCPNPFGHVCIAHSDRRYPVVHPRPHPRSDLVRRPDFGVRKYLGHRFVVVVQQRFDEVPACVPAEVRRYIAHAQPSAGQAIVEMRVPLCAPGPAEPVIEAAVGGEDFFSRPVGIVIQDE